MFVQAVWWWCVLYGQYNGMMFVQAICWCVLCGQCSGMMFVQAICWCVLYGQCSGMMFVQAIQCSGAQLVPRHPVLFMWLSLPHGRNGAVPPAS